MTNKIFALQKHIEGLHRQVWNEWIAQEKNEPKGENQPTKMRSSPTLSTFFLFFLGNEVPYL
jgi:hypothetical protein